MGRQHKEEQLGDSFVLGENLMSKWPLVRRWERE